MASASKFLLTPQTAGCYHVNGIKQESATKASELLQRNHEDSDIFFNEEAFHNHISHHVFTLYALGASPSELQKAYDDNITYQRPRQGTHKNATKDLANPATFAEHLGNSNGYGDYLQLFQSEIESKGYEAVINEYLFSGDERAEDLLVRLHAGFLHPAIHLGFGVEFQQPAMVAESLAETAVHENWLKPYYEGLKAVDNSKGGNGLSNKTLPELLDEIRSNKKLVNAPHWDDGNKLRDGVLARARDEMINIAAQWTVTPDQIEEKLAEMTNTAVYFTISAQHPPKQIKFDFYYMHCVTSSIFFRAFMSAPWLSPENKARLLELKGRSDLALYASRASPALLMDDIRSYKVNKKLLDLKDGDVWPQLFAKVCAMPDDGHASKFLRAIANAEVISKKYEGGKGFRVRGNDWEKLGQIALESVLEKGAKWVRSAGFDEAWVDYEDRRRAQL